MAVLLVLEEERKRKLLAAMPLPTLPAPRTAAMEEDADAAERRRRRDAALVANIFQVNGRVHFYLMIRGSKIQNPPLPLSAFCRQADAIGRQTAEGRTSGKRGAAGGRGVRAREDPKFGGKRFSDERKIF